MKYDRRRILKGALLLTGAALTVNSLPVPAEVLPELQEVDPDAIAIGYCSNARKVDKNKFPSYAAGQTCTNCALVGFSSAMRKPCSLVPGKLVAGGGWCVKWIKKG